MNQKDIESWLDQEKGGISVEFNRRVLKTALPLYGVTTPVLKKIARSLIGQVNWREWVRGCSYEEELLLALTIAGGPEDIENRLQNLLVFLEEVDSWAISDCAVPALKIKKLDRERVLYLVKQALSSPQTFVRRAGYILLLDYYIDADHIDFILSAVRDTPDYYVYMAEAWLLAECYIKIPDKSFEYFQACSLPPYLKTSTLRKIKDSFRVSPEDKVRIAAVLKSQKPAVKA